MTQDEIIRMAREAGITVYNNEIQSVECESDHLERFAAQVAEATKEKAAKVCEESLDAWHRLEYAAAIRSMK